MSRITEDTILYAIVYLETKTSVSLGPYRVRIVDL